MNRQASLLHSNNFEPFLKYEMFLNETVFRAGLGRKNNVQTKLHEKYQINNKIKSPLFT